MNREQYIQEVFDLLYEAETAKRNGGATSEQYQQILVKINYLSNFSEDLSLEDLVSMGFIIKYMKTFNLSLTLS